MAPSLYALRRHRRGAFVCSTGGDTLCGTMGPCDCSASKSSLHASTGRGWRTRFGSVCVLTRETDVRVKRRGVLPQSQKYVRNVENSHQKALITSTQALPRSTLPRPSRGLRLDQCLT